MGKSNYIEWKTTADLYLEINGYMPYVNGTKEEPDKALYFKKEDEETLSSRLPFVTRRVSGWVGFRVGFWVTFLRFGYP